MIAHVEGIILSALREAFPDLEVEPYRQSPKEYSFAHPRAALVPVLQEVGLASSVRLDGGGRVPLPAFNVAQFTRSIRPRDEQPGATQLLDDTFDVLEGRHVQLPGCAQVFSLRCERMFFIAAQPGGVWVYGQDWALAET